MRTRFAAVPEALGPLGMLSGDQERLWRFFEKMTALATADTVDEALKRIAHAARSLANADSATITRPLPEEGWSDIAAGHRVNAEATLERELEVGGKSYALLTVATTRSAFTAEEEALVDLLCVHAEMLIERVALKDHRDVLQRIRALVGEQQQTTGASIRQIGDLRLDLVRHETFVEGAAVHLTPSEFNLLELLSEEPGRVYSRSEIVSRLWHTDYDGSPRVADAHIARLRRKLERDPFHPRRLVGVRGVGYKLAGDVQ